MTNHPARPPRSGSREFGKPAYQAVADSLRERIARGDLAVDDPIPSTAKLTEEFGVSTTVVRAAVSQLRSDGLVVGSPGKAVYVRATPETQDTESVTLRSVADQVGAIRSELDRLATREAGGSDEVAELRAAVNELRQQFGVLHTQVIDLYSRMGHAYPHEAMSQARRASGQN